jgi:hypothetical protein
MRGKILATRGPYNAPAMATCPKCGGPLGDQHRCAGLGRLRLRLWGTRLAGALIGGGIGTLLLSLVYGRAAWPAVILAGVVGFLIVQAFQTRS